MHWKETETKYEKLSGNDSCNPASSINPTSVKSWGGGVRPLPWVAIAG